MNKLGILIKITKLKLLHYPTNSHNRKYELYFEIISSPKSTPITTVYNPSPNHNCLPDQKPQTNKYNLLFKTQTEMV